jgi:hypothetical protein
MKGIMLKAILCNRSVPQVEIDQRARDARLRLEQIEELFVPRGSVTGSWVSGSGGSVVFSASPAPASGRERSELAGR